jgi:hypothetical protein
MGMLVDVAELASEKLIVEDGFVGNGSGMVVGLGLPSLTLVVGNRVEVGTGAAVGD